MKGIKNYWTSYLARVLGIHHRQFAVLLDCTLKKTNNYFSQTNDDLCCRLFSKLTLTDLTVFLLLLLTETCMGISSPWVHTSLSRPASSTIFPAQGI
jgi:hypothetical protein